MAKPPKAPHPVGELTTTELAAYIDQLKKAIRGYLTEEDRRIVVTRLGEAFVEYNERVKVGAMPQARDATA